nr:hypothetical protein [Phascolarctobacterium succinatutens]
MLKDKAEITIRFSAAEYLTYVTSVGDLQDNIEMRYEDENILLIQNVMTFFQYFPNSFRRERVM